MAKRQFGSVRRLPSGRYQARYQDVSGYRHAATFATKADADVWLSTERTDQVRGEWIDPQAGTITFEDYATIWLEQRFDLRPRTVELYESLLRLHLVPDLGRIRLNEFTIPGLRSWHAAKVRSGKLSVNTVAKAYRLLHTILETAVEDGLIPRNPCNIKGAAVERPAERTPATIPEVVALAEAIGARYRMLVLVAAFTGLRWGELIALTRKRVDLDRRTIRVVEQYVEPTGGSMCLGPPKTAAGARTVAIPPHIIDDLQTHLCTVAESGPDGLIFASPEGEPLRRSNFNRRFFRPAATAVGLPRAFRFHDLRHTGNTLAASTGASTKELMVRLGHASPRAALIYQHASAERDQAIADAISRLAALEGGEALHGSANEDP